MITEEVGKRIQNIRKSKGLSQEKLALNAGMDRTYLAGIESGKRNATIVTLEKIVIALGVEMKDIF
jgi:transcriptional regulator with XRE-family HTH domain